MTLPSPFSRTTRAALSALALVIATAGMARAQDVSVESVAQPSKLVISQVYGSGGSGGATFRNDYVEIFNRGDQPVSLDGLSVQYTSPTGVGTFRGTALSGSLEPGQYYLVQFESSGLSGALLPAPDAIGSLNLGATSGKVALVNSSDDLPCNGGSDPCTPDEAALILDLVGYGTANFFEGSMAAVPPPTPTRGIFRGVDGCQDTDENRDDFDAEVPAPRNTASALRPCWGLSCPATITTGQGTPTSELLTARDDGGIVSAASIVSAPVAGIDLADFAAATQPGGTASVTLQVGGGVAAGVYPVEVGFASDVPGREARCTVDVSVNPLAVEVTDQTDQLLYGLVLNRASRLFVSSMRVMNASDMAVDGPIQVLLEGLAPEIGLANQSGTMYGWPYITYPLGLAPGEAVTIPLLYSNPQSLPLNYSVRVYSGAF